MGIAKGLWLEEQERGYSSSEGKTVCTNCFEDEGLKKFIEEHQDHTYCSYCEQDDVEACEFDSLVEHILVSIHHEWGHPSDEGLPYETREGGWQVSTVYDSWELLDEIGLDTIHGEAYENICSAIHNQEWCERNPYSLSHDRTLLYGWLNFSEFVKSKARFVFLKASNPNYDKDQHDEMDPVSILDALQAIVNKVGLVKLVDVTTQIYRVRVVNTGETLTTAKELGSPPQEFATMANRMSPAGIPMFYGAFDIETAVKETFEPCSSIKKAISGIFQPVRSLRVIDLSENLYIPSLFDEHERDNRDYMRFLFDFVGDFTKPIERSDSAHVDYVPTQVVTEYIRHIFRDESGNKIDGVIYPSSKNKGKKAIVIFAESDNCVESNEGSKTHAMLKMTGTEIKVLTAKRTMGDNEPLIHKTQTKDGHCVWPFEYSFNLNKVNCPRCIELIANGD